MAHIKKQPDFHEKLDRHDEVKGGSNRAFGLTVGGILLAIAAYRVVQASTMDWISWLLVALGGPLVLLGWVLPRLLTPLNRAWTKLGLVLSKIVNPIIMALIFFVTVTPIGLILRLARKDLLRLKWAPEAESYWICRQPPGPAPDTMKHQF